MVLEKIGYPRLKFPTELEFEPIQLCNALCFSCPYTFLQESKEYRGKKMSREYIKMLLEQFGDLLLKNEYENNIDFEKYKVFGKIFHKLRTEI